MKKITIILLAGLLLLFSTANADTTFANIPWLSNDVDTLHALSDAGLLRTNTTNSIFSNEGTAFIVENEVLGYQLNSTDYNNICCFAVPLNNNVKGKIAGYPVQDIILTFAYDGEYQLIAIKLALVNADYNSLKTKLTKVYGEGETKNIKEEALESTIWRGDNHSGILLYTESDGYDYTLIYGRLDAMEILTNCASIDPEDVSGL